MIERTAKSNNNVVPFPSEGSLDRFLIEARRLLATGYATDDDQHRVAITIAQLRMLVEAIRTPPTSGETWGDYMKRMESRTRLP